MNTKIFKLTDIPQADIVLRGPVTYDPKDLFMTKNIDRYIIDYDVKLSNGEHLQRPLVWNLEQKRNLIESLLKELSLPEFHVAQYKSAHSEKTGRDIVFKIIDGKQRLSTIQQFINNEFTFIWDDIEYFYSDFDKMSKYRIDHANLRFKIVYEYDDCLLTDKQLIDWFYMVNFAGTEQDRNHLNNLYESIKTN
jgi:uncharacterized protein with ParB-like and HNH nuclease domain